MISFSLIKDFKEIINLWNKEMGVIYPIAEAVFEKNVISYKEKFVYGAYLKEELIGFIIAKKCHDPNLTEYLSKGFLSLFYVSKKNRRKGIGTKLLEAAETYLSDKDEILLGRDIDNFFPGLPSDFNNLSDKWLISKGYESLRMTHDLINYNVKDYPIKNNNYIFRLANKNDSKELVDFFKSFSERWAYEGRDYFDAGGDGSEYILCLDKDKIIAFSRINDSSAYIGGYNINWYLRFKHLGGIGPLGVSKEYRSKGIGYDIVSAAIKELKKREVKEIIIDWTGLLEFYQQFDFEVWKTFQYMKKNRIKGLQKKPH